MIKRLSKAFLLGVTLAAALLSYTAAQAPQSSQEATAKELPREFPAPRNLKVLPKNLNGKQVQDIMEAWQAALNVKCEACHEWAKEKDKTIVASQLNLADDSKPMEDASRLMYVMTEEINSNSADDAAYFSAGAPEAPLEKRPILVLPRPPVH